MVESVSRAAVFVASRVPAVGLENALRLRLASDDEAIRRFPCCGVARNRNGIPASGVPAAAFHFDVRRLRVHYWDRSPQGIAHSRGHHRDESWSVSCRYVLIVDNATGCCAGRHRRAAVVGGGRRDRARRVVGAAARRIRRDRHRRALPHCRPARLLDSGHKDKTDAHDARSAAIVALRHRNLRAVRSRLPTDPATVGASSSPAHRGSDPGDLSVHAVLAEMIEGGLSKNLSARRASVRGSPGTRDAPRDRIT